MKSNSKQILWNILIVVGGITFTAAVWLLQTHSMLASETRKDQEWQLQVFTALLRSKGEGFRVEDGRLLAGDHVLNGNAEIPDTIRRIFGGTATIYLADLPVSSSLFTEDGFPASVPRLEGPAHEALFLRRESFTGEMSILGEPYLTAFAPLTEAGGEVIGALSVGVKKEDFLSALWRLHQEVLVVSCMMIGLFSTLAALLVRRNLVMRSALEENEAELKLTQFAVDSAEVCIYRISREGKILFVNEAATRYLGYSREELLTMGIPDIDPCYPMEFWPEHWEELRKNGSLTFESVHRARDGRTLPMEITAHYLKFGDREYNHAFARDISERKRAERLLQSKKEVLEGIAAGHSLEQTLSLLCRRMEELSEEGLCSVLLLDPESGCLRHCAGPSLPEEYGAALKRVSPGPRVGSCGTAAFLKDQVIVTDISEDPLWAGFRKLPLRHGLRACWSTPILSSAGEVYGTFAVYYRTPKAPEPFEFQNVSHATDLARIAIERKLAEEALQQSEERFRQIFEQNEDAIILLNMGTFNLIDANREAERLYGCTREGLFRLVPWGLLAPGDAQTFIQAVSSLPHKGGFHLDRLANVRLDGSAVTVSMWAKVIQLHNEEVLYCSIRDITEKARFETEMKANQARLIHANKMASLGMLVSGIAHEINNPNNCIGLNAALLADVWRDASPIFSLHHRENGDFHLAGIPWEEARETLPRLMEGVSRGSERIAAIVNNLREFVRGDRSGTGFPFDLSKVVRDAALILTHLIHKHTDHFQIDLPEGLPPARGNPQQVEQVVINLLTNALQALPRKSCALRVEASYDAEADCLLLRVRDEGRGMTRAVLEKITEPFFSTRLEEGGTGLGLFISASIVKEHGGSLEFDSRPGSGTTVTLSLPAAERPGSEEGSA